MMQRLVRQGWRQLSVLVALLLALTFLLRSLFTIQVLDAGSAGMLQHYRDEVASPQSQQPIRGTIVDANGMPLVNTVTVFKLGAYPLLIDAADRSQDAASITNIIAPLQLPTGTMAHNKKAIAAARKLYQQYYSQIYAKFKEPYSYVCLAGDDSGTCPVHSDVTLDQANAVRALKLPGFDLEARSRPDYPNGALAGQVLGFVNYIYPEGQAVDQGRYGIEEAYNSLLRAYRDASRCGRIRWGIRYASGPAAARQASKGPRSRCGSTATCN
jgi:cell division protein FtsI/penicillin-binding protein 2